MVGEVLGSYKIIKRIGAGGMGTVYLAEHIRMKKLYAIKVFSKDLLYSGTLVEKFRHEARIMADLIHTNIVRVHHIDEIDETLFLVMDYVSGPEGKPYTLADELAKGKMDYRRALAVAQDICKAMISAHAHGVVHRDLKPANILMNAKGQAIVSDFGLAKLMGTDLFEKSIMSSVVSLKEPQFAGDTLDLAGTMKRSEAGSNTMAIIGTYDFMSPEQKAGAEVDHRSDIYAFGLIFYQLLTGKKPGVRALLPSHISPKVPRFANKVTMRCLEEAPQDRYQSAEKILSALERLVHQRRPWIIVFVGLVVIISVLAVFARNNASRAREYALDALRNINNVDPNDGFDVLLKDIKATKKQADEYYKFMAYPWATRLYRELFDKSRSTIEAHTRRASALSAKVEAASAKDKIENMGAAEFAKEQCGKANGLMEEAETMFGQRSFDKAALSWRSAKIEYEKVQKSVSEHILTITSQPKEKTPKVQDVSKGIQEATDIETQTSETKGVEGETLRVRDTLEELPDEKSISLGGSIELDLLLIEAGEFDMGSESIDEVGMQNEWPAHLVKINKPFYMSKYEITQAQYQEILDKNPSNFKDPNCPVECVSWLDANEFCRKLSILKKGRFRLPTEAEWEYACRAGTKTTYSNGPDERALRKIGWYSYDGRWGSAGRPKPVGQFKPNMWGLYDMHGNVWEWCMDRYGQYSHDPVVDPSGPEEGELRAIRGGSWYMDASNCRSATRRGVKPETQENSLGFRVVQDIK